MRLRTAQIMWLALAALAPGALAAAVAWTPAVLLQAAVGIGSAMAADRAMLALRGDPSGESAVDGSAALAGAIVGLAVPPLAPVWVAAAAAVFGVCLAKHCYGGLGANVFNPAMVGYAFAYAAFPGEFAAWPDSGAAPAWSDAMGAVFGGERVDAVAGPTVIERGESVQDMDALEFAPPAMYALGGLALCALRIADWRLSMPYLLGIAAAAAVAASGDLGRIAVHLLAGGTVMAAFFVVTEPVCAPSRPGNRVVYGLLAGALTVAVREWGSHPDGIAFAVLFANMLAPAMDRIVFALEQRRRRG